MNWNEMVQDYIQCWTSVLVVLNLWFWLSELVLAPPLPGMTCLLLFEV